MHEFRASGRGGLCRLISECAHSGQEAVTGVWTSVLGAMLSAELGARVRDSSAATIAGQYRSPAWGESGIHTSA